ncbi:unnamed protein product [Symbiodinium sp. CCMP2592]|nr:unnamed protein product [Symbiodinium sp. CCMP2592]
MLNSLHCELIFNDLRDSQRRHRKAEVSKASNIATVAVRSGYRRSPLESIELKSADWSTAESLTALKSSVLQSARERDQNLGLNVYHLINDKSCGWLTKPHVYTERLRLYRNLLAEHRKDPRVNLEKVYDESWPCRLLLTGGLLKCRHTDEMQFALVVKSCANAVRFVQAVRVDPPSDLPDSTETYKIIGDGLVQETMQFSLGHGPIGITEPTVCRDRGLLFTVKKWKTVAEYLCEESIVHVPAGFLEKFCTAQSIGGKQKLKHHERVKQILQHFKYTDEYIDEVLSHIPVREKKQKHLDPSRTKTISMKKCDDEQEILDSLNYNVDNPDEDEEKQNQEGDHKEKAAEAKGEQPDEAMMREGPDAARAAASKVSRNILSHCKFFLVNILNAYSVGCIKEKEDDGYERAPNAGPNVRQPDHGLELLRHELPPGIKATIGRPAEAAPFIQLRIVSGDRFLGKGSRSWSFVPHGGAPLPRGTSRNFDEALLSGTTWVWRWFNSLGDDRKQEIRAKHPSSAPPCEGGDAPDQAELPRATRARH